MLNKIQQLCADDDSVVDRPWVLRRVGDIS